MRLDIPFLISCAFFLLFHRGQEQHIRYEHIYLSEPSGQSEVDYAEIKRPRLEMGPESLMRHTAHRPPMSMAAAEDLTKVSADCREMCELVPTPPRH